MADLQEDGVFIKELEEAPELFYEAVPFWEAFTELSSSRQSGFGLGGIPFSEITDWLNENDVFSLEQRNRYRRFINATNNAFANTKNESSGDKKKKTVKR